MSADVTASKISYDEAKELAAHADPAVRRALAARPDLRPEILYYLAEDADASVRQTVAENVAAPRHTYELLARDDDEDVRVGLADKISRLAPDLDEGQREKVWQATHEALTLLAHDQMTRVRQVLAEALKNVPGAPPDIVRKLASDVETAVAGPILEYSPVLTDEDLIEIIARGTASDNLGAISRRESVSENVSDAIVATDDVEAIASLLGNNSAQIREETLDTLIDKAPGVELWHAPLVKRSTLPNGAPQRLARFIADNLVSALEARTDIDSGTLAEVKDIVRERLNEDDGAAPERGSAMDFLNDDIPISMVRRLSQTSGLHDSIINSALQAEDHAFVMAALVVRSGLDESVVRRVFAERSPKGVVAVAWKTGMPAEFAVNLQQRMARIAPADVLHPPEPGNDKGTTFAYPLTKDEMDWQIEFFQDLARKAVN